MAIVAMIFFGGCETYHEKPINPRAVANAISRPDLSHIQISAARLQHPIFKPINIDLSNGLSADEAAVMAVILNPQLRTIRDQKGIANAQVLQAGLLPNPQLSLSLEIPFGAGTADKTTAGGLGLSWDIFSLITRHSRVSAARRTARSVDLAVAWKEWQVAEKAKLEFYRLLFAKQQNSISRKLMHTYEKFHDLMRKGLAMGQVTVLDVSESQYALKGAKEMLLRSHEEAAAARLALNRAIGLPPQQSLPLEKHVEMGLPLALPPQKQLVEGLQRTRLDLVALRLEYSSQEAHLKEAIQGQFPKISISLSGARDTDAIKTISPSITIGLPFFNHNQGKIAIERATRQKLYDQYLARLFKARADVARIYQSILHTQRQLDLKSKLIREIKQTARVYMDASMSGILRRVDYYNTLIKLYQAQLNRLNKEKHLAELGVALELATGWYGIAPRPQALSRESSKTKGEGK